MVKKIKFIMVIMVMASICCPVICHADTVTVPYGNTNTMIQTNPQDGGTYSRTDIIYAPGAGTSYGALYANGISANSIPDISGTQYTQITTSYGNTGMATVTVTPPALAGVPTDMDAYQMTYLSALQSYGLTIDPVTGQVVNVSQYIR